MPEAPSWRKIEAVLIDLLREEGFTPTYSRGDTYVLIYDGAGNEHEIDIGDFAKHLADRL